MANTSTGRTARLNTRVRPKVKTTVQLYAEAAKVSEAAAVDLLLADALERQPIDLPFVHESGVVHRDVCPECGA